VAKVTLVGLLCWAHVRRKFDEALKAFTRLGSPSWNGRPAGAHVLQSVVRDRTGNEESDARRTRDRPKGAQSPDSGCFFGMAASAKVSRPAEKRTGPSDHLLFESMGEVDRFPEGRTPGDRHNRSERAIKPFVIGRKNRLFANTPRGAKASAVIYRVIETAKENGLNPFQYLKYLFEQLPQLPDLKDTEALDPFLPWSSALPPICRVLKS
jgi:transposase